MQINLDIQNEVLRLIGRFEKNHSGLFGSTPELLQHYFGGSRRHWGNILHSNAQPTKIDLACLRLSIEFDGRRLQKASQSIRFYAANPEENYLRIKNYWPIDVDVFGTMPTTSRITKRQEKAPFIRRDGSLYDRDSWKSWEDCCGAY